MSYSIYLFQVTVLRRADKILNNKLQPFLKAYIYVIEHIIDQAKKHPDISFEFHYVFIGRAANQKDMNIAIQKSLD